MAPDLFPRKIYLLGKLTITKQKWHQICFNGKYGYWGKLQSLKRNGTRSISTKNISNREIKISEKKWHLIYFHGKYVYWKNLESLKKWHQIYFSGKYIC
jgi:hypothetical protein